jgi:hypothetical protein
MPRHEATAAVTFSITYVTDGLLCEFEKIITELVAIIAKIIAQMKYPNIFLSYIWFFLARSNQFSDNLLVYKHFSMINFPSDDCRGKLLLTVYVKKAFAQHGLNQQGLCGSWTSFWF